MSQKGTRPAEVAVVGKTHEWLIWLFKLTKEFRRDLRFSLGERLERRSLDLLENLVQAAFHRDRLALLRQANLDIEMLRHLTRVAHSLGALTTDQYGAACTQLEEIGRMVGGWVRSQRRASE